MSIRSRAQFSDRELPSLGEAGSHDRGKEYGLDHAAIVHGVERVAPAGKRRAEADDRVWHGEALVQQVDHALPHGVVVAEGSLQPDVAMHERIDVDGNHFGRPSDLAHQTVRPREPEPYL